MKWLLYGGMAVVIILAIVVLIGAALPKEHVVSRKIVLRASVADVFALIAGPSDWRGMKYELLTESPLKWRETDSSGSAITYERAETSASKRIVNRIADPKLPFGGSWTYEIEPVASGTEVTITENGEVYNPIFRFVSKFIMGHAATIEKYQRDLAAHFKA
jgi:Polyketide cyclase / dehydrase and lipid transport